MLFVPVLCICEINYLFVNFKLLQTTLISGPGTAIGLVCVCVFVMGNNEMTFVIDISLAGMS